MGIRVLAERCQGFLVSRDEGRSRRTKPFARRPSSSKNATAACRRGVTSFLIALSVTHSVTHSHLLSLSIENIHAHTRTIPLTISLALPLYPSLPFWPSGSKNATAACPRQEISRTSISLHFLRVKLIFSSRPAGAWRRTESTLQLHPCRRTESILQLHPTTQAQEIYPDAHRPRGLRVCVCECVSECVCVGVCVGVCESDCMCECECECECV